LDISASLFWSALACQRFVCLRLAAGYWPQDYEVVFRRLRTTNVERNVWFKGTGLPAPWEAASSRRTPKRRARSFPMPGNNPLETIRQLTAAWVHKDPQAMSLQLSEGITEIGPACAAPLAGKKNFFKKYRDYFNSSLQIESYKILRPRVLKLSSRLAMVHFNYRMRTVDNGVVKESKGKESMLVEKVGHRWLVRFIHWHRDADG